MRGRGPGHPAEATERVDHPLFARLYMRTAARMGDDAYRGELLAGLSGRVLCSVSDQQQAPAELRRVIRAGGELRFYEHVVSHGPVARRVQRVADATLWPRAVGGCHLARDTLAAIERAGFEIETSRRFRVSPGPPLPHVLGTARRT